jgi:hypothetical protein
MLQTQKIANEQSNLEKEFFQKELTKSNDEQERLKSKTISLSKSYELHNTQMEDM